MSLVAGARLGPYEIIAPLGVGGMGEVYRAVDTRLKRQVAIKILPSVLATPDGVTRFEREAELLASLNHPNIAQIYGAVEASSSDARDAEPGRPVVHGLVMELVEGPTLGDCIKQGPLPVTEAFAFAQQIAAALEAAHEQGIVHRDLKPANVKVRDDGTVKVLDFGLAKLVAPGEQDSQSNRAIPALSQSPTLISPAAMTGVGMILGTAAYMSPEQARGKSVDKRTDVWAFGAVLYEMLSGRRAFPGDDLADLIAAVMKTTPDWSALPLDVPPVVIALIKGCLEKDRAVRIGDLAAARFLLATDVRATASEAPKPVTRSRRELLPWAVAAMALVLGVAIGWVIPRSAGRDALVTQLQTGVLPAEQLVGSTASTRPARTAMSIAPDGRSLVFVGVRENTRQLYSRSLDRAEATPIPGTEGAAAPFFSPDGAWIAFWTETRAESTLKKIPVAGGPPVTIPNAATGRGFGASWGEDGTIFYATRPGIFKVSSAGGMPEAVTKPDGGERHLLPHVLPGGKALLFTSVTIGWDTANILLRSLDTGQQRVLIQGGTDARYVDTGQVVYMKLGTLMAVPFDIASLQITGQPVALIEGVMHGINAPNGNDETGAGQYAISPTGSLAYILGGVGKFLESSFVWVDRKGVAEPLAAAPVRPYLFPRLSPAGDKIAVGIRSGVGRGTDLWVYDVARGAPTRLTFDGAGNSVWSPDGKRLAVFMNVGPKDSGLYTLAADGSGTPQPVKSVEGPQNPGSWAPGSNGLAVLKQGEPNRVWVLPTQGDAKPTAFLESRFNLFYPEFSPDGRLMAYVSTESGSQEVYVQPYPGPGEKIRVSTNGGFEPLWSPDGRELFYRAAPADRQQFFAATVTSLLPFRTGTPRLLFENKTFEYDNTVPIRSWNVSPDGKRFLLLRFVPPTDRPVTSMQIVLNWTEELKRRAPARK
ncbi:MAG TPA: protein kinase [Vicinamibacterales bacterium]|jgi:serine/threonine-protein kinase